MSAKVALHSVSVAWIGCMALVLAGAAGQSLRQAIDPARVVLLVRVVANAAALLLFAALLR